MYRGCRHGKNGAYVDLQVGEDFPPGFFNPMQHLILHLPYKARMGGLCRAVSAIQLRDFKRFFELNVKINAKFKHP